ncbi:MAG: transcriptional regulator [Candidatus Marinimicrobia bacterium]|nr:transcriptional regulator [Candidatus Neomarinimicrobiota bacterium]
MTTGSPAPFDALAPIFHEPRRLALMTALCGAPRGLSFGELKRICAVTDGNLNRHLKVLEDARVIALRKVRVGARRRTVVEASDRGRDDFLAYLAVLEEVLHRAADAAGLEFDTVSESVRSRAAVVQPG